MLLSTDINFCLNEFTRLFNGAVDIVAPFRDIKIRQKISPWMNSHILAGIRKRDRLLSQFRKDRSNVAVYREFCKVRNSIQRDIKDAKGCFFRRKVEQNRGDSGKLWSHLKSLGYSKSGSSCSNIVLEENGIKVFEPSKVAHIFNDFYTSIASNLVNLLPAATGLFSTTCRSFRDLYSRKLGLRDRFILTPVSRFTIRKHLLSLNPKKAVGLDDVASNFLRDGANSIVEPVAHIINLSITTETVPSSFKDAKVLPLFKKGSKLDPGNYRPVSILSVLSKVLERVVHTQLKEYLEKRDLLYKNQSGFRGKYSTDTCLIGLSDFIKGEMGRGKLIGLVMIDLQKAFDTVEHSILLEKLNAIGVTSNRWFESYLSRRRQCVEVNGTRSIFKEVTFGVPQGSILGPQLFLIYINDMHISLNCRLALYADDSALIFSHKNCDIISEQLSNELSNCKKWLTDNKLSLHVGKTECMLFGSSKRLKRVRDFQISCDGIAVKQVTSVTYLGVKLDQNVKGKVHVADVIRKCVGRVSFLYRNSALLDVNCRRILCSALIQPYLDYCCSSWYSSLTKQLRLRLDTLQNRMVRFIFSRDGMSHVDTGDLRQLSWLTVPDRVKYFKLIHVFKIRQGTAPDYLISDFKAVTELHSHRTRGSLFNYNVSRDLANSPTSFAYTGIKHWNSLPSFLKEIKSEWIFKRKLKQFLTSDY